MDKGSTVPDGNELQPSEGELRLQVSLSGMDIADSLRIDLPHQSGDNSLSEFLEQVFPADETSQQQMSSMLDVRANPDLPEIYDAILAAFDEWRDGRCELEFFGDGELPLDLGAAVATQVLQGGEGLDGGNPPDPPLRKGGFAWALHLRIRRTYSALAYAVQQGFWDSKSELMGWLQSHTLLYFMDKHECSIASEPDGEAEEALLSVAGLLQSGGLIAVSQEAPSFTISTEGRRAIGRLLAETESYIDLYDHFKDTVFGEDAETVEFDTGQGTDLRVPVFISEGLDPIRTVFLLRMYDGTLDAFASTWQDRIDDESFFDSLLEPVVNRQGVDEALIDRIIGAGYVYLEERHQSARESAEREEIIQRVRAES
ncbi:MAG: hypothetical protein CMJ62_04625 [Planctomycetaceae bacterium]|jgi:hypothetical protein|nr:hypothetical protein [Planctomycetaceae bacterium]